MANRLQKVIYVVSSFSPVIITFDVVWWWQNGHDIYNVNLGQILLLLVAISAITALFIGFNYARGALEIETVHLNELASLDMWVVAYIGTYILPFGSLVINDFHIGILGLIILFLLVTVSVTNIKLPNPLLMIKGYHFFSVGIEGAASEYILISHRKLQGPSNVSYIKQLFNFILIDAEK
jgi:hypothetical protein